MKKISFTSVQILSFLTLPYPLADLRVMSPDRPHGPKISQFYAIFFLIFAKLYVGVPPLPTAKNFLNFTGGCQLHVENKIVPIEISSKIGQMLYKL